jgi:hypothetical protein
LDIPSATANCWEAVITAAILSGVITDPIKLADAYGSSDVKFTGSLVNAFIGGKQHDFVSGPAVGLLPVRGDVVLFDGLAHIALATGDAFNGPSAMPLYPGRRVISFWPAPAEKDFDEGTIRAAKRLSRRRSS